MANVDFLLNQSLLQICVSLQGSHPSYLAILTISIFQHCYIYMTLLPQQPQQGKKHWKDKNQQLNIFSLKWHIVLPLMFYQPVTVTWLCVTSREKGNGTSSHTWTSMIISYWQIIEMPTIIYWYQDPFSWVGHILV